MVDVGVVGAGMAGLTAARVLAERGVSVLLVEARKRVGGRILSERVAGGGVVELGAEFVHGRAPELWALIAEAGVETAERHGAMLRESQDGLALDGEEDSIFKPLEQLEEYQGEDVPFAEWMADSDMEEWEKAALTGYVEGFNAADAGRIGVKSLGAQQKAEDASEGDRSWHVRGGYAQLAEYLETRVRGLGVEVKLGCEVLAVRWAAGAVVVETAAGAIHAARCVVTLPLGVLQQVNLSGGIQMEPAPAAMAAARRLAMGYATRFTMVFRERWWLGCVAIEAEALREMNFVFTPQRMPPVWWTAGGEQEVFPTLTGWVGGPKAVAFRGLSAEELGASACVALAKVFSVDPSVVWGALVSTHTHDWAADRLSAGAYSYVPAGATDAPFAMARAEKDTLYFAGEHTDVTGHWGTVHAAIRSGLRAAAQILGEEVVT
jgi:monoamine oxidase